MFGIGVNQVTPKFCSHFPTWVKIRLRLHAENQIFAVRLKLHHPGGGGLFPSMFFKSGHTLSQLEVPNRFF